MVALCQLREEVQLHICTSYTCLSPIYIWAGYEPVASSTELGLRHRGLVNSLQSAWLSPWEIKEKHLIAKVMKRSFPPVWAGPQQPGLCQPLRAAAVPGPDSGWTPGICNRWPKTLLALKQLQLLSHHPVGMILSKWTPRWAVKRSLQTWPNSVWIPAGCLREDQL